MNMDLEIVERWKRVDGGGHGCTMLVPRPSLQPRVSWVISLTDNATTIT